MKENYFMGLDGFVWFTGVVENRNDPAKLGRVQVRCLGYHTEDLIDIPSADLPWAHIMHPVTDPSMQGMGNTPTFLVEGTWVIGFFRDANEKQQPIIMGSLPGYPMEAGSDFGGDYGFTDPNGVYPSLQRKGSNHSINESDVSRLARDGDAETHKSLSDRRAGITKGIAAASKPNIPTVSTDTGKEENPRFSEPTPRGTKPTGQYPFNHVHESESGHVQEIDDTPGGERLLKQHMSGTYEEIVADGTKTVKVVGNNYEIIAGASNIFVTGNVNMTTYGTKREYIKGDYILEVGGKYTRKIHGSEQVKIGAGGAGNLEESILGNHAYNVGGTVRGAIGTDTEATNKDFDLSVGGNFGTTITGDQFVSSVGEMSLQSVSKNVRITAFENIGLMSILKVSIVSGSDMAIKTAGKIAIKSTGIGTLLFSGIDSTVTAVNSSELGIGLTTHFHRDTPGLGSNPTSVPEEAAV